MARLTGQIEQQTQVLIFVLGFLAMDQLAFLTPYRRALLDHYLWHIAGAAAVLFANLFALFYLLGRRIFLRDTGRKLAHVEKTRLQPLA